MSNDRKLHILIVILAHNDHATLPSVVQSVAVTGYDFLVIDDGSSDHSLQSIAGIQCTTLALTEHKGKGAALLEGAKYAARHTYDHIISIDGDDQHNPKDIYLLIETAKNSTIPCLVVGVPQEGKEQQPENVHHRSRSTAHFWVRLECGLEIPDAKSSFRLYPVKELLALRLRQKKSGFAIETLVKFSWSGVPVHSVILPSSCGATKERSGIADRLGESLEVAFLHCQLVLRRLLPWPYKKLIQQEPLPKMVASALSRNPLKVLREVCREHTSPLWLAMAVWLGLFMGALPLLAMHTIAIIYVAHRLHMNKVAAVAASQFCMPPVVPVLCIQVGYYLRKGELLIDFSWQPWLLGIHERLWEWLLGSLLVGPLLGITGATIMYLTARHLQIGRSKDGNTYPP